MFRSAARSLMLAGSVALLLGAAVSGARALTVSDPVVDTQTQGQWVGVYGECLHLLPSGDPREIEIPVGPGFYSANPGQYAATTCAGGPLFANNLVDWRIFKEGLTCESNGSITCSTDAQCPGSRCSNGAWAWTYNDSNVRPGADQYNPCLGTARNGVWDNEMFASDPLTLEILLTVGGDMRLAYYFMNGNDECRDLGYTLTIDDVIQKTGTIGDFAAGSYVYFDISGLAATQSDPAVIRFQTVDAPGIASCNPQPRFAGVNSLIGGAFIDGTDLCRPPYLCEKPGSIASNFNGTAIRAGDWVWFNSVMKIKSPICNGQDVRIAFTNQRVDAPGRFGVDLPDSEVVYSVSATAATTVFSGGKWITTIPCSCNDKTKPVFLGGFPMLVPPGGIRGGSNPVTWSGNFKTNTPGTKLQWQWAAAVYDNDNFGLDYNALGVKPVESGNCSQYNNSDHAGTPENFKRYVIGGARGGGGSNFTGSLSSTKEVAICQ